MPLATQALVTLNAATVAFAHGLSSAGVARTPNFVCIMPQAAGTAITFGFAITFDSITMSISRGIATDVACQVFAKRCHTIEDAGGTF